MEKEIMNTVRRSAVLLLLLLVAGFPGCGGGTSSTADTSGSSGFSSGADRNKLLASFAPDEVDRICQSYDRFFEEVITPELLCQLTAVIYVSTDSAFPSPAMCLEAVSQCFRELGAEVEEIVSGITPECPRQGFSQPNCEVTVREWEQCVEQLRSNFVKLNERASCSNFESLSSADVLMRLQSPPPSPKCQEIQARCPEAFQPNPSEQN